MIITNQFHHLKQVKKKTVQKPKNDKTITVPKPIKFKTKPVPRNIVKQNNFFQL